MTWILPLVVLSLPIYDGYLVFSFWSSMIVTVLKSIAQLFCRLSLNLELMFFIIRLKLYIFDKNTTKLMMCSQCIISEVHDVDIFYYW